jgi:hypothetical protein
MRRPRPLSVEELEARVLLNTAPVLTLPQTTFNVVKTTTLSVTASATDKDSGQTLTFSLVNPPTGAKITSTQVQTSTGSAATGALTWTPTEDQGPTAYSFTVKVSDNGNPVRSVSQTITVNTLADGLVDNSQVGLNQPGQSLLIVGTSANQGTATNPGNDVASVSAASNPNTVSVTINGATSSFNVPTGGQIITKLFGGNDSFTLNEGTGIPIGPPLSVDGGIGTNTVTVNGTAGTDGFTITGTTVGLSGAGVLTYSNTQILNVNGLGGNDTFSMSGINSGTATTLDAGTGADSFTSTFAQGYNGSLTLANLESATMQVTGDFSGSLTVNSPGIFQSLLVTGTVTSGSTITATNMTNVTLGTLAGTLLASTTTTVSIGTLSGSFTVPENPNAPAGTTGVMSNTTITSITSTGTVSTGSISGMFVGTAKPGSVITAAGQGTTTNVSIGTLSGSFTAPEDPSVPSGTSTGVMSNTTINTITSTGFVSTGSISGMFIGTANSGSIIKASGQGTTTNVSVGTLSGSFTAPADTTVPSGTTTGVMRNTTIGTVTSTGFVSTGSISGMSVGTANFGSSITATGQGTTNVSIGVLSGSFTAPENPTAPSGTTTGVMSSTTINSITSTGVVSTGSISGMSIGTADFGSIVIAKGQGTATDFSATTFGGSLAVPADSTPGSGILNNASFGTLLSTATLMAGHFNLVTAQHTAPVVNFNEQPFAAPAVTRTLSMTPHSGTAVPDYGFYYDGTGTGDPLVVVQVAVNTTSPVSFDFGATTSTSTSSGAGFDLAGLYSVDQNGNQNVLTGIHNVVIGGNLLLGAVPSGAVSFFNLPTNTPGGVQLPQDTIAVAAAGNLPAASIVAQSVQAVAAGSFAGVAADNAGHSDAFVPLASTTGVTQANDTYQVFVTVANDVVQFLDTGPGGSFDAKGMLFAQLNPTTGSVPAPVTAADTLVQSGSSTTVQSVVFTGQGGSLTTAQPITTSISALPGGSLGNLILSSPGGITANITADSILGNIDATNGGISGIIEATVGDIGRAITDPGGTITGVTSIQAGGGGLTATGKILAKGNLVSQVSVKSGLDGVVAADGDIGVIQTVNGVAQTNPDGSLIRFGGITVSTGGLNGQVIALGNVFGDISVTGGLSGRIAVQGKEEFGLSTGQSFSRTGILGNVSIGGGISATGAVVSAGLLGDDGTDNIKNDSTGTQLTISGTDKGILAAGEDINFGSTGSLNKAGVFENANGPNLAAIEAIFTGVVNGNDIELDVTVPAQLQLIINDLLALTVSKGQLTGTTP